MEPKPKVEAGQEELAQKAQERFRILGEKTVIAGALERIRTVTPKDLTYHNISHTTEVLEEAILLAITDKKLSDHEVELLAIAAVYHDIGYIQQKTENEEIGAKMAAEAMKQYGYSDGDIQVVMKVILDTKLTQTDKGLKQISHSRISNYLLDADLGAFGKENYFDTAELLFQEFQRTGRTSLSKKAFFEESLQFFQAHDWNTEAGRRLRQPQKEENIKKIQAILGIKINDR